MKSSFSQQFARLARSLVHRPTPRPLVRPPFRPVLESLEDRTLPSTLTVVNLNDHGAGSLRAELAQAHSGDTIVFAPQLQGSLGEPSGQPLGAVVVVDRVHQPAGDLGQTAENHVFEIR